MRTLPVALQVYSVREDAEKDFVNTMQEIKSMGYNGVELAGLYGQSPEEVRDILKKTELTPVCAHVSYQEFMENLESTVNAYATIGCRYLAIPYLLEEYRYPNDKFQEVMQNIPIISKACKKVGITLLYHNHDFEYDKMTDGRYVLDYIYQEIPEEELKVELDTCWVKYVGIDPAKYLQQYAGRCPIVHLKDFTIEEEFEFCAVGYGVQNIPSILEETLSGGTEWVVVEQDRHTKYTAIEDARLSRAYLKNLGW